MRVRACERTCVREGVSACVRVCVVCVCVCDMFVFSCFYKEGHRRMGKIVLCVHPLKIKIRSFIHSRVLNHVASHELLSFRRRISYSNRINPSKVNLIICMCCDYGGFFFHLRLVTTTSYLHGPTLDLFSVSTSNHCFITSVFGAD